MGGQKAPEWALGELRWDPVQSQVTYYIIVQTGLKQQMWVPCLLSSSFIEIASEPADDLMFGGYKDSAGEMPLPPQCQPRATRGRCTVSSSSSPSSYVFLLLCIFTSKPVPLHLQHELLSDPKTLEWYMRSSLPSPCSSAESCLSLMSRAPWPNLTTALPKVPQHFDAPVTLHVFSPLHLRCP